VLDSASTMHMSFAEEDFEFLEPIDGYEVTVGGMGKLKATHKGTVRFNARGDDGSIIPCTLSDTLFVPDLGFRLMSETLVMERVGNVVWDHPTSSVRVFGDGFSLSFERHGNLWILPMIGSGDTEHALITAIDAHTAHLRYGHASPAKINALVKQGHVTLCDGETATVCRDCCVCNTAKMSRHDVSKVATHSGEVVVQADIAIFPRSLRNERFALVFLDRQTRYATAYTLKSKSTDSVVTCLDHYLSTIVPLKRDDARITVVQTDAESQLISPEWEHRCAQSGVLTRHSPPHTQAKNGGAEKVIGTLQGIMRAFMHQARASVGFWALAFLAAVYCYNRLPNSAIGFRLPYEEWSGRRADIADVRTWGSQMFVHIPKSQRGGKTEPVAWRGILVGQSFNTQAHLVYNPSTKRVVESYHCVVHESISGFDGAPMQFVGVGAHPVVAEELRVLDALHDSDTDSAGMIDDGGDEIADDFDFPLLPDEPDDHPPPQQLDHDNDHAVAQFDDGDISSDHGASDDDVPDEQREPPLDQPGTGGRPVPIDIPPAQPGTGGRPGRVQLDELQTIFGPPRALIGSLRPDPQSHAEAMASGEHREWRAAEERELEKFIAMSTFECKRIVDIPKGAVPITCHFVYRRKYDSKGQLLEYKARLVANGSRQRRGVNYFYSSSPVVEGAHLRTILAIAASKGWKIFQGDVASAYLNAELDEDVYMYPPPGWKGSGEVWLLQKSVYGLKQAGYNWYRCLGKRLRAMGFRRSTVDDCIYIKCVDSAIVVFSFHVDDLIFTGSDEVLTQREMIQLGAEFTLKTGVANWVLGLALQQSEVGVTLDVSQYCDKMLERFGMSDCNAARVPLAPNVFLRDNISGATTKEPYLQLVGSIMYAATVARPDLALVASELGRFMKDPREEHMTAAKNVLKYIKGTLGRRLVYPRGGDSILRVYVDADYAGDRDTRKSRTGYVIFLGDAAVEWRSTKQTCTTTSTFTAELVALSEAVKALVPLRVLCEELEVPQRAATIVFEDNRAAYLFANEGSGLRKAKHIDVRHHYVRELVDDGIVDVKQCSSEEQLADVFTKALAVEKFERYVGKIMKD
jgi:transposase InsO family protein